jgi:hypothetical protein
VTQGRKTCGKCGKRRPRSAFGRNATKRDGLASNCKPCRAAYAQQWYSAHQGTHGARVAATKRKARARARAVVREHLEAHPCVDCGLADWRCLELDHVRGRKLGNVSDMVRTGVGPERVRRELAKCEVRCANCHRIRTGRTQGWAGHG